MKDYYNILGVGKNASQKDIQKAFRGLAQKYHPDKPGGDSVKFKEVNEAYQVLNNQEKRAQYDAGGYAGPGTQGHQGFGGGQQGFGGFDFSNFNMSGSGFEDIIREAMKFQRASQNKGRDVQINIQITFEDSVFGTTKTIEIPYRNKAKEKVEIKIPAGIQNNEQIWLDGKGEPAKQKGYPDGGLLIVISVKPHKEFQRHGGELVLPIDLLPTEALLGIKKEVKDLKGSPLLLTIPELTKEGDAILFPGKGIPQPAGTGRLVVLCHIKSPKKITSRAKELLEQLQKEGL